MELLNMLNMLKVCIHMQTCCSCIA